jgi:hypothetical protein
MMVKNNQLIQLEPQLKAFSKNFYQKPNVFEVIRVSHKELVHSNLIAWLFATDNNYGVGYYFFKEFIKVLRKRYAHNNLIYKLEKLSDHDINNIEVFREKLRTDIIINFKNSKIMIVIENKIFSSEHSNQLEKYQKLVEREYGKNYQYLYLYLTPEGYPPKNSTNWLPISYFEVNEVLHSIKKEVVNYEFIESYQKILEDKILKKGPLAKEAKLIYKNNRQVFDFIFNLIDKKELSSEFIQDQLKDSLSKLNLKFLRGQNKYINFTIKGISEYFGDFGDGTWIKDHPKEYFSLEFVLEWNKEDLLKVRLKAVVGPTINNNLKKLTQFLIKNNHQLFKIKGKMGHKRHTTVYSEIIYSSKSDVFDHEDFERNIKLYFDDNFNNTISKFNDYFIKFGEDIKKELLNN